MNTKLLVLLLSVIFTSGCYTQYEVTHRTTVTEEETVVNTETNDTTVTYKNYTIDSPYWESNPWPYYYWSYPYWGFSYYGWFNSFYFPPHYRYPRVHVVPPRIHRHEVVPGPRRITPPTHRDFGGVRPYTLPPRQYNAPPRQPMRSTTPQSYYGREGSRPAPTYSAPQNTYTAPQNNSRQGGERPAPSQAPANSNTGRSGSRR